MPDTTTLLNDLDAIDEALRKKTFVLVRQHQVANENFENLLSSYRNDAEVWTQSLSTPPKQPSFSKSYVGFFAVAVAVGLTAGYSIAAYANTSK
jgi:hypothetical protein